MQTSVKLTMLANMLSRHIHFRPRGYLDAAVTVLEELPVEVKVDIPLIETTIGYIKRKIANGSEDRTGGVKRLLSKISRKLRYIEQCNGLIERIDFHEMKVVFIHTRLGKYRIELIPHGDTYVLSMGDESSPIAVFYITIATERDTYMDICKTLLRYGFDFNGPEWGNDGSRGG